MGRGRAKVQKQQVKKVFTELLLSFTHILLGELVSDSDSSQHDSDIENGRQMRKRARQITDEDEEENY